MPSRFMLCSLLAKNIYRNSEYTLPKLRVLGTSMFVDTNFADIQNHWAKTSIIATVRRNIFRGYPDGTFRPSASVTRAELAAIIYTAFAQQPSVRPGITFKDVPANHWAAKVIAAAYQAKFLSGYPDGLFNPLLSLP